MKHDVRASGDEGVDVSPTRDVDLEAIDCERSGDPIVRPYDVGENETRDRPAAERPVYGEPLSQLATDHSCRAGNQGPHSSVA
jgi:hypothetical protein